MSASIGTQNISFSGLKAAYVAGGGSTANNNLKDGETDTEVKLSYFYSSEFTDDSSIGSSGAISVSDFKNKTFGAPITLIDTLDTSFLEISNRFVASNSYMGNSLDYTGPYDVSVTHIDHTGDYKIYIGIKVTTTPTYYNDISVAAVQVVSSSGTVKETWIFNSNSTTWETYTSQTAAQSSTGFPVSPSEAAKYSYSDISTSYGTGKFSLVTYTGSSYTGTADGIATTTSAFTSGDGQVSQSSNTYYMYRETSGSTRYTGTIMRSPTVSLESGDTIRVVHLVVGYSYYPMNANDSLYLGLYPDLTTSFYEISNRFIASDTYMGNSNDYTGAYDVSNTVVTESGNYRIYIGVKVTASTTFYNDISIAAVQIVNSTGTVVQDRWLFAFTSGLEWQTYTSQTTAKSDRGFPITPQTASGYTYSDVGGSQLVTRFAYTSYTGSSYTGTKDSIGWNTSVWSVGDAQISQTLNTNYFYRETSGSTRWTGTVMRSPVHNFSVGDQIRVVHLLAGYSGNPMDPKDSLYLGLYADSGS